MITAAPRPAPPSEDKRWKLVNVAMRRNGYARSALIEVLHAVQDGFGYLEPESLRFVAESLHVPLSAVYGVATFYHHFTLRPPGKHTCVVCTGTACYIKGSPKLLDHLRSTHNLQSGQTTPDGAVSLLTARCVGTCSMAPTVVFDGQVKGEVTLKQLNTQIKEWRR